jgi:L-amino acid N-acyltransferase YncA
MDEEFKIRKLRNEDCKEAARIRFEVQEMDFLPSLGINFYIEWLKGTCESKWGFGLVCIDSEERIAGFVCASTHLQKYYRDIILRKGIFLAFWSSVRVLAQPRLLGGLLQYSGDSEKNSLSLVKAEWLTMVVAEKYRGKGLGKKLTTAVIEEYKKSGVEEFLSTVSSDNIISCSIHEKNGFELLGTFELHGRKNLYKYSL